MRTKDEILLDVRHDIQDKEHKAEAELWLEYRKIEVLIDIRNILYSHLTQDELAYFKEFEKL